MAVAAGVLQAGDHQGGTAVGTGIGYMIGNEKDKQKASDMSRASRARAYAHDVWDAQTIPVPLSAEDQCVQSMPDVSPSKWHLAHVTWFFEQFILREYRSDYTAIDDRYHYLFNSYYNTVGEQFPRPQRGLVTRPGLAER